MANKKKKRDALKDFIITVKVIDKRTGQAIMKFDKQIIEDFQETWEMIVNKLK